MDRSANSLTHYRLVPEGEKISAGAKSIYEDADGNLWVAASMGGLYKLDPSRTRFVRYRTNANDPDDRRIGRTHRDFRRS